MNNIDLVIENEKLIESYDLNLYLANNQIGVFTALRALETTNEAQKYYISSCYKGEKTGERILDLYGFLQSLFASIDGLYELSYQFEGNKNILNLNDDPNLRELKHIRNDVVGHPANLSWNHKNCYCVLNNKSIDRYKFTYNIYSYSDVITKEVNLEELLTAYYNKANMVLRYFLNRKPSKQALKKFPNDILAILTSIDRENFVRNLNLIISKYNKIINTSNSRVNWYLKEINELDSIRTKDKTLKNIIFDAIYFSSTKIYNILSNKKVDLTYTYSKGTNIIKSVIVNNRDLRENRKYLTDITHPHFKNVYTKLKKELIRYKSLDSFLVLLESTIESKNSELFFVLMFMTKLI